MSRVWVFDETTLQAALAAWHAAELHLPADRQGQVLAFLYSEAVRERRMSMEIKPGSLSMPDPPRPAEEKKP